MATAPTEGVPQFNGKPIIYGIVGQPGQDKLTYFHATMPKRALLGMLLTMVEQLRLEAVVEGLVEARLVEIPKVQAVGNGVLAPDGSRLV